MAKFAQGESPAASLVASTSFAAKWESSSKLPSLPRYTTCVIYALSKQPPDQGLLVHTVMITSRPRHGPMIIGTTKIQMASIRPKPLSYVSWTRSPHITLLFPHEKNHGDEGKLCASPDGHIGGYFALVTHSHH